MRLANGRGHQFGRVMEVGLSIRHDNGAELCGGVGSPEAFVSHVQGQRVCKTMKELQARFGGDYRWAGPGINHDVKMWIDYCCLRQRVADFVADRIIDLVGDIGKVYCVIDDFGTGLLQEVVLHSRSVCSP